MNEFQKFVVHVRNLKSKKVKQATFDVDFLDQILQDVSPTPLAIKQTIIDANRAIDADGGKFQED
jgi:hypothetical protein